MINALDIEESGFKVKCVCSNIYKEWAEPCGPLFMPWSTIKNTCITCGHDKACHAPPINHSEE